MHMSSFLNCEMFILTRFSFADCLRNPMSSPMFGPKVPRVVMQIPMHLWLLNLSKAEYLFAFSCSAWVASCKAFFPRAVIASSSLITKSKAALHTFPLYWWSSPPKSFLWRSYGYPSESQVNVKSGMMISDFPSSSNLAIPGFSYSTKSFGMDRNWSTMTRFPNVCLVVRIGPLHWQLVGWYSSHLLPQSGQEAFVFCFVAVVYSSFSWVSPFLDKSVSSTASVISGSKSLVLAELPKH